jgi:hypothetical protein
VGGAWSTRWARRSVGDPAGSRYSWGLHAGGVEPPARAAVGQYSARAVLVLQAEGRGSSPAAVTTHHGCHSRFMAGHRVCRRLVRPGLITPEARKREKADHVRFERARSMGLWQMDIVAGAHAVDSPEAKVVTGVSDGPPVAAGTAVRATARSDRWHSAEAARSRAISSRCVRVQATPHHHLRLPQPALSGCHVAVVRRAS